MIFKTLPSIISSINQLGEASNKLKAINFSIVGLNAGNLDAYRNAISGISKEQAALLLSTQGLNQAQIDLVLSNEKVTASEIAEAATLDGVAKKKSILTVEQQKQLISSQALTTEKLAEISATLGLETAENGSLISKKALNAEMVKQQLESIGVVGSTQAQIMNMLGLTTAETSAATASNVLSGAMAKLSLAMSANPIGALVTVIGIAIASVYGLTKAFDALTDSAEEIDGRVDDLISKYNDLKTTADNNASTVESLADEYESLSKGVNNLGENVSLTSEEYARYNEIVNQIADMFPTMITGYTDEDTAILSLKGNVEQLRDAYKEAQQEAYNLLVATGKDSDGNDIMESYKNLSELDWWDSSLNTDDVTTVVKRDITKQILDLMSNMDTAVEEYDKLAQMIFDTYGDKGYNFLEEMGLPAIKDVFSDTSGITEEALIAGRVTVQSYYQGFQSEIDTKLSKVKLVANAFLNTNDFYLDDSTSSELKNALSVMVNSIDEELANTFNGEHVKVGAYVNNIVDSIKDNEEVQKELIELFTMDTSDMSVDKIKKKTDLYISIIAEVLKENPIELKTRLGFDDSDTQPLINNVKEKLQDDFDDKVGELTLEELQIAAEQVEVPEGTLLSWDELKQKIEEVKNTDPKTFKQAWKALGITGDDEKLLELAKAGELTPEVLENNKTFANLLKSVGNSATIAADKINKMVEASDQLSSMKTGISAISNVLAEKKANLSNKKTKETGIGADTLAGFDAEIKGLDSWENFEKTLGNGKSIMEECQQAANKLATEWVNSNNFLSKLNNTNKDYYISTLKEMGVKNAEAVVTAALTKKQQELNIEKKWLAAATKDESNETKNLSSATAEQIEKYADENEWAGKTKNAVYALAIQKRTANGVHLNTQEDIRQMEALVKGIGGANDAITTYKEMLKHGGSYSTTELANAWEKAKKQIEDAAKMASEDTTVDVDVDPSSTTSDSNNSSKPNSNKKTKQSFDWLERKVSTLTNKLDLLKAKIENVFTVQKKNSIIDQEITKTNKLIKTYKKQANVYKKQAKSSAKSKKTVTGEEKTKLSSGLQKKIQNGQIKGTKKQLIKTYGEKKANAIEEYQEYWDKYQTARKNRQDAVKSKRELKIQKHQNWVDYYDSVGSQYDAQIEIASTAKAKNKLEKDKLKYVEKSYNQQIKIAKLEQDSVKASTLLAQKWKEIADSRERILQNQLDENADKRDYNNAAYENADNAGKKSLHQSNIATYKGDDQSYAENVQSAQKNANTANSNISKTANAASKRLKKESIDSKIAKEIKGYLNSGKKVPDKYLKMAEYTYPKLYQKLVEYNNTIDAAGIANDALAKAQENQQKAAEENKTAIREEQSQSIQLDIDSATNSKDLLSAQYNNLFTAKEKNDNIDAQLQQQEISHNKTIEQINNDITDPAERNVALAKEEAEWVTTQREQSVLKLQNLADEESAQYTLKQQMEANANTAKEKNKYEADSRENLKSQYAYEIQIARNNGDITEEKRLQAELEEQIAESYKKQIENLKEEYDLIIGIQDARKSTIDSQISALQANGYNVATELYKEQQEIDLNNYNETLSKISDITAEMQNLDPESQDYKNYLMELESYKQEAWGYQQAWAEAQQAINDINLSKIEYVGTLLGYQANQLEHIQNILGHSDFTLSDKDIGGLTIEGLSSAAMTLGQMKNNNDQIANKWDQIAEINRQIDAKEYVGTKEQAEEDIYNLIKEIEGLEEANYDFGESIKNMVIDSLNSLSDALEESITKYKDALQAQKDLYDYRRKVADQLKSIASLEKQLAALEGSDTEEARARIQKLKIELEEEQQNLKDTEYEKYIQDQEEMLDRVSEDFQDFIANVMDMSVSEICAAVGNAVSDHEDDISQAIIDAFAESDAIKSVADNMTSLGKIMSAIDFSTNITLNTDSSGKVTGMSVNGEEIDVPGKDNGMSNVTNDIENSTENSEDTQKEMRSAISYILTYASNYIPLGSSRINSDPLNQYIYPKYHKMLDDNEEDMLLQYLGIADSRSEQGALSKAVEKMKELGFSQGGMVSQLNKVALDNGDDGWATLKRGESVLTPAQTEQFRKLTENLVPLNNLAEKMRTTNNNLPSIQPQNNVSTTVKQMDIHLDGSNVVDADSFIKTLHNPKVLQEISNGVSSQLGTVRSNRLGRF